MYYGSFDENKEEERPFNHEGEYVEAVTEEPLSGVKLVPISLQKPGDDDFDNEDSGSPVFIKKNSVAPTNASSEDVADLKDEKDQDEKRGIFGSLSEIKDLVSNFTAEEEVADEDGTADVTLIQAAAEGEITVVKQWVSEIEAMNKELECELNLTDNNGFTPLQMAARYNRKNVVNFLIEKGADMNKKGKEGLTALHLATKYNMTSTAKTLINKGADVNMLTEYGTTVLLFAARRGNVELVQMLVDMPNVQVNESDNSLDTPLHAAMVGGNEAVVKLLLDNGADVYAKNREGELPIHYAAAENQPDLIIALTKGAVKDCTDGIEKKKKQTDFINLGDNEMDTALHIAAQCGYEETVKTLISVGASVSCQTDDKQTPLHLAAIGGQMAVVKFLIMNHAKVNAKDNQLATPLHKACQFGRLEVCRFLLQSGAKLNAQDCDNYTPLMLAVWKGQNEIVEFLISEGADIVATDMHSKNVLHLAVEENEDEMLELLLRKGAKSLIDVGDKDYSTPLHYAATGGNIEAVEMLLDNGASIDSVDNNEKNPIHMAAEKGHTNCVNMLGEVAPGSLNYSSETGKSPLHFAAMNGHKATCSALIEMGAETSSRDDINWTPLDYAALNGHSKVISVLLDNDALVDAVDKSCSTPLHHASENGHVDCITILLNNGASISQKNILNKNCLDLAVENGQVEACMALIQHDRWKEVMRTVDDDGRHPMEKLIAVAPSVANIVLDKCLNITKEDYVDKNGNKIHVDKVHYDFEFLDISPEMQVKQTFFAPSNMVKHQRETLLSHRLTVKLISDKWVRLGRWIYILSLFFYMLFLALLTALLIIEREKDPTKVKDASKSTFEKAVPWLTLILAIGQIGKEVLQIYYLGIQYFKEYVNYLELLLYLTTILFMAPFLDEQLNTKITATNNIWNDIKWNAGALAILIAWSNLLLYLKRFPFFGLYVVMFTEVFKTLVSVLFVFSIFIFGFALSFYLLLDRDQGFKYPGRSIIKTFVMTIGEFEYSDVFTENDLQGNIPYKALSYIIFVVFMALMPILVMNFLVGLAVGDIEAVRKNAYLRILRAQVNILLTIENSYPMWLLKKVYRPSTVDYIKEKMTFQEKLQSWWLKSHYEAVVEEQEDIGGNEDNMKRELEANGIEIYKQKKRLKNVFELLDEQREMIDSVCEQLEIDEDD